MMVTATLLSSAGALPAQSSAATKGDPASGLTSEEAGHRLATVGPNAMPDTALHPLRRALGKFWAPVPWMLEAAIVLELALGKYVEGAIIAGLLVFNAALGLFQESRARATLAALKSRLALNAIVRRDGQWAWWLRMCGSLAGEVLLDQSMLTGESIPIEAGPGLQTYAGVLVRRGDPPSRCERLGWQMGQVHSESGVVARCVLDAVPIVCAPVNAGGCQRSMRGVLPAGSERIL